jgi:hypothetical protein
VFFTAVAESPAPGTFASGQPRNAYYGAGFQNWNLALFKEFPFGETHRIQFRAEAFNFPNHPNLGGTSDSLRAPTSDPRNASFGRITQKSSERNIQLSLRYSF